MNATADIERLLLDTERFARELLAPRVIAWERERRIGRELFDEAHRIGLTRVELPVQWGGLGLPFSAKVQMSERLA
ncbi:MAG: acyl-CoA dehydrogenase family protein, partial [Quisquiliibacterium sp.]